MRVVRLHLAKPALAAAATCTLLASALPATAQITPPPSAQPGYGADRDAPPAPPHGPIDPRRPGVHGPAGAGNGEAPPPPPPQRLAMLGCPGPETGPRPGDLRDPRPDRGPVRLNERAPPPPPPGAGPDAPPPPR